MFWRLRIDLSSIGDLIAVNALKPSLNCKSIWKYLIIVNQLKTDLTKKYNTETINFHYNIYKNYNNSAQRALIKQ